LKKGEIIEATIETIEFPNKGIAIVEDKKIIIKNTVAGQKVSAKIIKKKGKKIEARVLEILERSELEIDSPCPHDEDCGGCKYLTLPYEHQLAMKSRQVKGILEKGGITDFEFEPILGSPQQFEYRNKMEFTFGDEYKGGPLTLGMHQMGKSFEMLTVDKCQIVDVDFQTVLMTVLNYFKKLDLPYYRVRAREGVLRHLVIRKAVKTGEILVNLVTTTQAEVPVEGMKEALLSQSYKGEIAGILHTLNDSFSDVVQSDETRVLHGRDYIKEELLGLKFNISAFSFFQTNSLGAEKLYEIVREYAGDVDQKIVYDLFSGTGTIGQIMAPVASKVYGIELIEEAVEAAKDNAKLNKLQNCDFIAGDVFVKVDELKKRGEKPDIIVLDPPRPGVSEKALKKIIEFGAETIVYVSCKPSSLVDNLNQLMQAGYVIEKVRCVDMFPQTPHVETCVRLTLKNSHS
jgi:23S rRNA (uracil-5-)-methyltransferase RumA